MAKIKPKPHLCAAVILDILVRQQRFCAGIMHKHKKMRQVQNAANIRLEPAELAC